MGRLVAPDRRRTLRAVPLTLALAMLAVVVVAGLLPDTGVVSASSNCSYGKCPASTPFPFWAVSAAVVVVVIALILALLLLRRHRRRPPAGSSAPGEAVEGGAATGGGSAGAWQEGTGQGSQDWNEPGSEPGSDVDQGTSEESASDGSS